MTQSHSQPQTFATFMATMGKLTAPTHNLFGMSMSGMGSNAGMMQGGQGMGADIALQLNRSAVAFAQAYQQDEANQLATAGGKLEASLLLLQTVGAITPAFADELIGQLHELLPQTA
jgi:hypothetical protein